MGRRCFPRSLPRQLQLSVAGRSVPRALLTALQFAALAGQHELLADQLLPGQPHVRILGESQLLARQPECVWVEGHQLLAQLGEHAVLAEQSQLFAHVPCVHVLAVESAANVECQLLTVALHHPLVDELHPGSIVQSRVVDVPHVFYVIARLLALLAVLGVLCISQLFAEFAGMRWQSAVYTGQFDELVGAEVFADVAQVQLPQPLQSSFDELLADELSLFAGQHRVLADESFQPGSDHSYLLAVESDVLVARGLQSDESIAVGVGVAVNRWGI